MRVMLFGEAPGPLGADKSGIPFWGDRAGRPVFRALEAAGLALVPPAAYEDWDGARLKERGLEPILHGVALSNAFPSCPTRDGQTFRAPTDRELASSENLNRIEHELSMAAMLCPGRLRVIAMGKRAEWLIRRIEGGPVFDLFTLPHPSAQGLLQAAPAKGKGLKLADLQAGWECRLQALLGL